MADDGKKNQPGFNNAQRADDGKKALAEYEAQSAAVRARTERLKALRLAKEAADAAANPGRAASTGSAKTSRSTKTAKGKQSSGTLSEWLKDRENGGHRT